MVNRSNGAKGQGGPEIRNCFGVWQLQMFWRPLKMAPAHGGNSSQIAWGFSSSRGSDISQFSKGLGGEGTF